MKLSLLNIPRTQYPPGQAKPGQGCQASQPTAKLVQSRNRNILVRVTHNVFLYSSLLADCCSSPEALPPREDRRPKALSILRPRPTMPGPYSKVWVNAKWSFRGVLLGDYEVYIPRFYRFRQVKEACPSTATWDEWKVRGAWWSPNAKWTWIQARETESYETPNVTYPQILSFEAASGQSRKLEPLPSICPIATYCNLLAPLCCNPLALL